MNWGEEARKATHVAFGLFALLLRWITPLQGATLAALALFSNRFILPHIGGRLISRTDKGYDRGILLYPLAVMILILVFWSRPVFAATIWAVLAFGDGFATLAGRILEGPRLPWNRDKSFSGLIAFFLSAWPIWLVAKFVQNDSTAPSLLPTVLVVTAICGVVESLHTNIDDNITIPLAGGLSIAAMSLVTHLPVVSLDRGSTIWLGVNIALAAIGFAVRSVSISGAAGGACLGAILILFAGPPLYIVLLVFFVVGSVVTKVGYQSKLARGLAQEQEGRRGFSHAFANVGLAATLALLVSSTARPELFYLAAVAALATAAADTTASEVGQLIGRRTFLPLSFRRVPVGTEGAISLEGTVAGLCAGVLVAATGVSGLASMLESRAAPSSTSVYSDSAVELTLWVTLAAVAGSYIESIVGSWNRKRINAVPNGVLNFFNTMVGAALMIVILTLQTKR